ncbi:hypothetical protein N1851_030936 [Merluccius polli]|uniref:Uncharacterized protein n=1 Tax=Merluccius polli TaxID=89951 RepID=A0AA47M4V5_MERPO|nr:hypothetical protein N1851_030936 [Merluccius polli]
MSNGGRKSLVWDIRKGLLTLSAEELFRVARAVDPALDADQSELTEGDQEPSSSPLGEPASQSAREGIVSLRELSYLPRREFKVQGGQVGDQSSDISYNNLCKQIDDGIREGFSDSEIVRGVLKIIRPGIFKEMLINKDDLQTHLREKNNTDENETPQQFLYRVIGLKQRTLFTSKLADADKYSAATVQDVFLYTVYQGFGHKHTDIRRELKPLLSSSGVTDEMILRHVMKITSEENERMKRLGSSRRQTVTNTHSVQLEPDGVKRPSPKSESVESKSNQTKPDPPRDLTTKVEELTRLVMTMQKQNQQQLTHNGRHSSQNRTQSKPVWNNTDKTVNIVSYVGMKDTVQQVAKETGKLKPATGGGHLVTESGCKSQPTPKLDMQQGRVRTGAKDIILPASQVSRVKCRVPSNMDAST